MAIISASRRTDIPAFYSDWLFNRLEEGYVIAFWYGEKYLALSVCLWNLRF